MPGVRVAFMVSCVLLATSLRAEENTSFNLPDVVTGSFALPPSFEVSPAQFKTLADSLVSHQITSLSLEGHREINDEMVANRADKTILTELNLKGTSIRNASLETMGALKNLEILDVSDDVIDDDGLSALQSLKKLKVFRAKNT